MKEEKTSHPSSSLIHHPLYLPPALENPWPLVAGTGAGRRRRRKQCLEFVKKLESFPHVNLRLSSSSPSQMQVAFRFHSNHKLFHSSAKVTNDSTTKLVLLLPDTYNLFLSLSLFKEDIQEKQMLMIFFKLGAI